MTHQEYVYLLYKAHLLWDLECKAAKRGEAFQPCNHFEPVADGALEAQARIYRPREGAPLELTLCLRYANSAPAPLRAINEAAQKFFGELPHTEIPPHTSNGRVHHVFFTTAVPKSVIPVG